MFGRQSLEIGQPLAQFAQAGGRPYWLKEGVRLTFYSASASIPATANYYYPDEHGEWVDEHGNRYSQGDNPGPAGHGISQVNIACVDGGRAVVQVRSYGYSNGNGPLVPLATSGFVCDASQADFWMDPKSLQNLRPAEQQGVKILRIPWTANGKTYKAIAFKTDARNAHAFKVYDLVTGLLLNANSSSVSADGRQLLVQTKFLDWRVVHWPWEHTNAPGWVASTQALHYQGSYRMFVPGSPEIPIGMTDVVTFKQKARRWAEMTLTSSMQSRLRYGPDAQLGRHRYRAGNVRGYMGRPRFASQTPARPGSRPR